MNMNISCAELGILTESDADILSEDIEMALERYHDHIQFYGSGTPGLLESLATLLTFFPEHPALLIRRAYLLIRLGNNDAALQDLQRILAQNSTHQDALFYRIRIQCEQGNYEAVSMDELAQCADQYTIACAYFSALVYFHRGQLCEAQESLGQVVHENGTLNLIDWSHGSFDKFDIQYLQYQIFFAMRQYDNARTILNRTLEEMRVLGLGPIFHARHQKILWADVVLSSKEEDASPGGERRSLDTYLTYYPNEVQALRRRQALCHMAPKRHAIMTEYAAKPLAARRTGYQAYQEALVEADEAMAQAVKDEYTLSKCQPASLTSLCKFAFFKHEPQYYIAQTLLELPRSERQTMQAVFDDVGINRVTLSAMRDTFHPGVPAHQTALDQLDVVAPDDKMGQKRAKLF